MEGRADPTFVVVVVIVAVAVIVIVVVVVVVVAVVVVVVVVVIINNERRTLLSILWLHLPLLLSILCLLSIFLPLEAMRTGGCVGVGE
jgi:hypothetical protein